MVREVERANAASPHRYAQCVNVPVVKVEQSARRAGIGRTEREEQGPWCGIARADGASHGETHAGEGVSPMSSRSRETHRELKWTVFVRPVSAQRDRQRAQLG